MSVPSERRRRIDFHSHTYLTDGANSATDMWFAADLCGHQALAITDHVGLDDPRRILEHLAAEATAFEEGPMVTLIGVELSMLPARRIAEAARRARAAGAEIVIVHGETLSEPVPRGTNRAALESPDVSVLAHPGLLEPKDAELAKERGVFLELSARKGHALANGHVARVALEAGADLVVDSDAHATLDLLTLGAARNIALGAGLRAEDVLRALHEGPEKLLRRLGKL